MVFMESKCGIYFEGEDQSTVIACLNLDIKSLFNAMDTMEIHVHVHRYCCYSCSQVFGAVYTREDAHKTTHGQSCT